MKKGSYCILFRLTEAVTVETKGRKRFKLKRGLYGYAGSAMGSGGVEKRVERHLRREKKPHWHLDFLTVTPSFKAEKVLVFYGKNVECEVARALSKIGKAVPGFGSSDCKCESHLIELKDLKEAEDVLKALGAVLYHKGQNG